MINKKQITCNFCNSNNSKPFFNGEWPIVKCQNCGFIFTNPIPENLEAFYSEEYFKDIRHSDKFYNTDGSIKTSEGDYFGGILDIENYSKTRGKLLEIGAARGGFLKKMKDRSWEVYGVEISVDAVNIAHQINNLELYRGDYLSYHTKQQFNVICMYQTLEHLPNPKEVLTKVYNEIEQEGILVIEVPNVEGWDIKWDEERKRLVYDLPRHLNHFSPSFLKKELLKLGFEILEINRYMPDFLLKLLSHRNQQLKKSKENVSKHVEVKNIPLLKKNITWKLRLLNLVSIFFPGWRFTIIARKR
jgi:2-polyprenyl-3-methyl-5-hydroxy-6-metoxy-1,4-benzoquinol methylase